MKWLIPTFACGAGLITFVAGLMYGVITVGVPTPDAPPAVAAREVRDADLGFAVAAAGMLLMAAGTVGLVAVAVVRLVRRRRRDA